MKKETIRKLDFLLIMIMILSLLPVSSLASPMLILDFGPDMDAIITENSPNLADVVAFTEEKSLGYGPGGKFLAPINDPDPNAIKIYTAQDLDSVRNNLGGSYVLMNDIAGNNIYVFAVRLPNGEIGEDISFSFKLFVSLLM